MAYDPYYTDQDDYYQDPGYDEYGYPEPTPPPTPDKNWEDPVKVNREYLKKIQKNCIHKGFEGLKEDGLFLFEVMARSVSLNKNVFESLVSKDNQEKPIMSFVKVLDTPFVELSETEQAGSRRSSGEFKPNSILSNRKHSLTNLFQSIYSVTGAHDSLLPEIEDEAKGKHKDEDKGGEDEEQTDSEIMETPSESWKVENPIEDTDTNIAEVETIQIMKGKSVLLPMPGLSMIQKLQQYPLILKVTRCDVTEASEELEGETLATSSIRISECFRTAVLMSSKPATVLPLVVVSTGKHKLLDAQGMEVGEAELTVVLTCFGKGAVNCVSEVKNTHEYEHTFLLRHLKIKHVVVESSAPTVDPRLAKEIIKLGLFFPSQSTSSEILRDCISTNLIPTDEQERKHAHSQKDCGWFHMVKKACPSPSSHSFDFERYKKEMEMKRAALWLKHKRICRDLKNNPTVLGRSLDDRFKEIQTGVAVLDTQNPFEKSPNNSGSSLSLKSYHSNMSPLRNSNPVNL